VLCKFEDLAVTSDVIKQTFKNFYEFQEFHKIQIFFLQILNTEVMNSQSMHL